MFRRARRILLATVTGAFVFAGISPQAHGVPVRCHDDPGGPPVVMSVPVEWEQADTGASAPEGDVENEIQCGGIPGRLLLSSTRVNTSAFTVKKGASIHEQRGQSWFIQRDYSGHGGGYWKLFSNLGKRVATLAVDGRILRG